MSLWMFLSAGSLMMMMIIITSGCFNEGLLSRNQFLHFEHFWQKATDIPIIQVATLYLPDTSSLWTYFKCVVVLFCFYLFYILQIRPLNRVRKLGEIGYISDGTFSVKETANFVQKWRKGGDLPPPFPNGWFALLESDCLKKGEVKSITALGKNLAVFRAHNGTAHVVDTYCPHLGANLAVGGRVIGDCLECPFHAWQFRGENGQCVHIPYAEKIPDMAKIKSWPTHEISGWVFIWYHSEGLGPLWVIPAVEELQTKKWIYRGRTEHFVNCHIQEVSENGADVNHLRQVHGPIITAGTNLLTMWNKYWSFAGHHWTANWEPGTDPDGHIGHLKLTHAISIFGVMIPMLNLAVMARQLGPGLVYLEFDGLFGRGMFLMTVTPQGPLLQRVVHRIYTNTWIPTSLAKVYMIAEAIQVERDIMIWNNKQFAGRPLFVKSKEDVLLSRHRRWYSQFYSGKSSSFFQKENLSF